MHKESIIHRDIKPENLVFDSHGYLRLTDFGIAQIWVEENSKENSGTPGYMAPEVMFRLNHGIAADYFAVGVIAYECIMGRRPYLGRSRKEIRDAIVQKQAMIKAKDIPAGYGYEAADFVNRCLMRQAHKRLGINGIDELKHHAWFKNFDWEGLKNKKLIAPFIPDIKRKNFDNNHVNNRGWNDTEEIMEQQKILNRQSQKAVFETYYFDKAKATPDGHRMSTKMRRDLDEEDEDRSTLLVDGGDGDSNYGEGGNTDFNKSDVKASRPSVIKNKAALNNSDINSFALDNRRSNF